MVRTMPLYGANPSPKALPMQSSNSANVVTRDQLIVEHIGLVHHVARKMHRQLSSQASLDDLVSAGTLGLMSAADAFDPARGAAFTAPSRPAPAFAVQSSMTTCANRTTFPGRYGGRRAP